VVILQITLHGSDGYLKKCGDLLLEDHGFPFEWITLNSCRLLNLSEGVRVVEDVLAVVFRTGEELFNGDALTPFEDGHDGWGTSLKAR